MVGVLVSGCVGIPTSSTTYGMIAEGRLEALPGLTRQDVLAELGAPMAEINYTGDNYLIYQGTTKWDEGVLLPAPWFVFVPFFIAGASGALEDMAHEHTCYRVAMDDNDAVTHVDVRHSNSPGCLYEFWGDADNRSWSQPAASIEKFSERDSPAIRTCEHIELKFLMKAGEARHEADRILMPPGTIRIGVAHPRISTESHEVEFNASPGGRYWVTWICHPQRCVTIVDAESSNIVGMDSSCPANRKLIGTSVRKSPECW